MAGLQDHVAERHSVARPILFVNGIEPSPRCVVHRESVFGFANVTESDFRIDSGDWEPALPTALEFRLPTLRQARITLRLRNATERRAAPVQTNYEIDVRIAEVATLRGVEKAFTQHLATTPLSRALLHEFVHDPRCAGAGKDYAEGFANFALGILLKERPPSEALNMPYFRYRDAYRAAQHTLADLDRPLARLVSTVIRFALNDFAPGEPPTHYWELDVARALLNDPACRVLPERPDAGRGRRAICPVDHGSGRVLDLAARLCTETRWSRILSDECRRMATSEVLDEVDRQKAFAVWAVSAWRLGAKDEAVEPLGQISAVYPFSRWAEPYLETIAT
jgi:hypothetical protein